MKYHYEKKNDFPRRFSVAVMGQGEKKVMSQQSKPGISSAISEIAHRLNVKLTAQLLLLKSRITQEIPLFRTVFFSVFIWGILAHGYMFTSHALSHDSLTEFESGLYSNNWKFSSGRFIAPLYRVLFRSSVTVPWIIGLLALLWCTLTLWLICKSYKITSRWQIVLLGGCLTTNLSFIATTATYIHDLDQNMLGLFFSVLAVFLWKEYRSGWLTGSLFIAFSLGLYQAFLSVAATLLIFDLLRMLSRGYDWNVFFKKCFAAAGMFLLGGFIYMVFLKMMPLISGVQLSSGEYNSLGNQSRTLKTVIDNLGIVYIKTYKHLFSSPTNYAFGLVASLKLILLFLAGTVLFSGQNRKVTAGRRVFMILLCAVLPVALQIPLLLAGFTHELMLFSYCIVYVGIIILLFNVKKCRTLVQTLTFVLFASICWSNVQAANSLYVRKRLEHDAVQSFMTRVLDKVENYPGYKPGKTRVVFLGSPPEFYNAFSWKRYHELVGAWPDFHMTHTKEWFDSYIKFFMQNKMVLVDVDTFKKLNKDPRFYDVPPFPDPRSMFNVYV